MPSKSCERLKLTEEQEAELTGFSENVAGAIAHLRDAWNIADGGNTPGVVEAIAVLLARTRSCTEHPELFKGVLGSVKLAIEVQAAIERMSPKPLVVHRFVRSPEGLRTACGSETLEIKTLMPVPKVTCPGCLK